MVEFSIDHKLMASSGKHGVMIDWFDDNGNPKQIDITTIDTDKLWEMRHRMVRYHREQLDAIDKELESWSTVNCAVCDMEQVAYRGYPFITWGLRDGYILCPKHLRAYDLKGTPEGEKQDQEREEARQIQELFGG